MTHDELLRRIRLMPYEAIMLLTGKEMWKLTDGFDEELVREIVAKHTTPKGQRDAIRSLKIVWAKALQELGRQGTTTLPQYFEDWIFDLKTTVLVEAAPPVSNMVKIDTPPSPNNTSKDGAVAVASKVVNNVADKLRELNARIAELQAENEQLKSIIKEKDAEIDSLKQQLKEQSNANNTNTGNDNTDEIIEQLKPIFWSDEGQIKSFLDKIRGKKNTAVIAVIADGVTDRTISEQSCRRDLWDVLFKHHLYLASESNYNQALNKALAARKKDKGL